MANFKIGQKVVCVRTHSAGLIKKGIIYIIETIVQCPCGKTVLNIGTNNHTCCSVCGHSFGGSFLCSTLFRPLQHKYNLIKNSELIEVIEETIDSPVKEPAI
jgi:hypothetical protein